MTVPFSSEIRCFNGLLSIGYRADRGCAEPFMIFKPLSGDPVKIRFSFDKIEDLRCILDCLDQECYSINEHIARIETCQYEDRSDEFVLDYFGGD